MSSRSAQRGAWQDMHRFCSALLSSYLRPLYTQFLIPQHKQVAHSHTVFVYRWLDVVKKSRRI